MPGIITQEGTPVDEEPEEYEEYEEYSPEEDLRNIAKDFTKGFRKFRDGTLFKIGIIAVAIKVVGVAGQIIIEKQRLNAALKDRQQERERDDK